MLVEGFPAQYAGTNCYVVAPDAGEQCVVVDPGVGVGPQLADVLERHRLHAVAVLLTHGHLDHTFSVLPVCQATGVAAYVHAADRRMLADPWYGLGMAPGAPLLGVEGLTFAEPDDVREIADGEQLDLAGLRFTVRDAPGHTKGSVLFGFDTEATGAEPVVLSGDVLFAGSIGRTDLPSGSMADMRASLRDVVLPLPDDTVVHPGHGPSTTMARERATNPYLQGLTP
ncbi:MBL fold metallo-hydrolase [Jatrophihabitans sp. YIM 134969]